MSLRRGGQNIFAAVILISLLGSCGGRTKLRGGEPCPYDEDTTRVCNDICGTGLTTCRDGFWSECLVEEVVEACKNTCGDGTRTCSQREWSECEVEKVVKECSFGCGLGKEVCRDDKWKACDAPPPLPPVLTAIIRDFHSVHPDFEALGRGRENGLVESRLGEDGKPVYAGGSAGTVSTTGPVEFDQWYRDVEGVNDSLEIKLTLEASPHLEDFYVYRNYRFFPIDHQLFGNEENLHNFHFTLEGVATFFYREGQTFRFEGDDDVWVFINGHLVIDLGGTHTPMEAEVNLDDVAEEIGIEPNNEYSLHLFFAERHTLASNFTIETSIANLGQCPN